jgi:hypothetical protein
MARKLKIETRQEFVDTLAALSWLGSNLMNSCWKEWGKNRQLTAFECKVFSKMHNMQYIMSDLQKFIEDDMGLEATDNQSELQFLRNVELKFATKRAQDRDYEGEE